MALFLIWKKNMLLICLLGYKNIKTMNSYHSHTFIIEHPQTGEEYTGIAEFEVQYDPGVWTYPNGDPGYPSSWECELISWELNDGSKPDWVTDDILYKITEEFENLPDRTDSYYDSDDRYEEMMDK